MVVTGVMVLLAGDDPGASLAAGGAPVAVSGDTAVPWLDRGALPWSRGGDRRSGPATPQVVRAVKSAAPDAREPIARTPGEPIARASGVPSLRASGAPSVRVSGAPSVRVSGESHGGVGLLLLGGLGGTLGVQLSGIAGLGAQEAGDGGASATVAVPGVATAGVGASGSGDPAVAGDDAAVVRGEGPSAHTDQHATEYFQKRWGEDDKALKRINDIRTVGGYLRIYTDLPESASNSRVAITLCKRGLAYLKETGVAKPVVFVQAEYGENGNPVLANILGRSDTTCRVTHPAPD